MAFVDGDAVQKVADAAVEMSEVGQARDRPEQEGEERGTGRSEDREACATAHRSSSFSITAIATSRTSG